VVLCIYTSLDWRWGVGQPLSVVCVHVVGFLPRLKSRVSALWSLWISVSA